MNAIDLDRLERAASRLGDAVVDPAIWPDLLVELCRATGAASSVLLQCDVRTFDVPRTPEFEEGIQFYFRNNWHLYDTRAQRGVPRMLAGENVIIDEDLTMHDELRRDPFHNECLLPFDVPWFAGIGFRAGSALWALSLQRTSRQGQFTAQEKPILATLCRRLTEVATLSTAIGRIALTGATGTLAALSQPAVAVDRHGRVLEANDPAAAMFDDQLCVRGQRLFLADAQAQDELADFVARMRATPDTDALVAAPIVVRRQQQQPVLMHILPVPAAARNPFLGARALLTLTSLEPRRGPDPALLVRAFALSLSEAKVAALIAEGLSPEEAAARIGVSVHTVRAQLKAVFAKTDTHRQSELVALLARL